MPRDGDALGGLFQNGSVTESNFLDMLGIILFARLPIAVTHRTSGQEVSRTDKKSANRDV